MTTKRRVKHPPLPQEWPKQFQGAEGDEVWIYCSTVKMVGVSSLSQPVGGIRVFLDNGSHADLDLSERDRLAGWLGLLP